MRKKYCVEDIVQIRNGLLAAIRANQKKIITLLLNRGGAQVNFYRGDLRDDSRLIFGRFTYRPASIPPALFLAV